MKIVVALKTITINEKTPAEIQAELFANGFRMTFIERKNSGIVTHYQHKETLEETTETVWKSNLE